MTGAIILAAGRSQRMGTQKLLLPFAGSTIIGRVVQAFLGAPVDVVLVVIRAGDAAIRETLAGRPVSFTENPDPNGDMLSSVRCGLRALDPGVDTILVCPGDLPFIRPGLIQAMLTGFRGGRRSLMVPVHGSRRGHPLILSAGHREAVLGGCDGIGLRGLLQSHASEVHEWPVDDPAVLADVDTPDDYRCAGGEPGEGKTGLRLPDESGINGAC